MNEQLARIAGNLIGRLTGPLTFRLALQPGMAIILAVRAGWHDAENGRPAFLWDAVFDPAHRRELLRSGWKDVAKVFLAAVVIDVVYQVIALGWVYPGEALLVGFLLAVVPYVLIRGPINRLARLWMRRGKQV